MALVPEACFPEAVFSGGQGLLGAAALVVQTGPFSGSARGILIELEGALEILWFKLVIL